MCTSILQYFNTVNPHSANMRFNIAAYITVFKYWKKSGILTFYPYPQTVNNKEKFVQFHKHQYKTIQKISH